MSPLFELGVRGHDFGTMSATLLADKIHEAGFTTLQLALAKALDHQDLGPGQLDASKAGAISATFREKGIRISVLGCYINPVEQDAAKRTASIRRFADHLAVAHAMGNPVVGTETGWIGKEGDSNDRAETRSSATLSRFMDTLAGLIQIARNHNARIAIEGVCRNTIWNPRLMAQVLSTFRGPELVAIYDPVNYLDIDNHGQQERLINEAFDLYGDRMVALHAKDFRIEGGSLRTCPLGQGMLDWPLVMKRMKEVAIFNGSPMPVLLEDTRPHDLPSARSAMAAIIEDLA